MNGKLEVDELSENVAVRKVNRDFKNEEGEELLKRNGYQNDLKVWSFSAFPRQDHSVFLLKPLADAQEADLQSINVEIGSQLGPQTKQLDIAVEKNKLHDGINAISKKDPSRDEVIISENKMKSNDPKGVELLDTEQERPRTEVELTSTARNIDQLMSKSVPIVSRDEGDRAKSHKLVTVNDGSPSGRNLESPGKMPVLNLEKNSSVIIKKEIERLSDITQNKHVEEETAKEIKENPMNVHTETVSKNDLPTFQQFMFADVVGTSTQLIEAKQIKVVRIGEDAANVLKEIKPEVAAALEVNNAQAKTDAAGQPLKKTKAVEHPVDKNVPPKAPAVDKPKVSILKKWWARIVNRYNIIMFTNISRFFGKDFAKETKKLNPVAAADIPSTVFKNYKEMCEKQRMKPKYRKLYPLNKALYRFTKRDWIISCILRVIKQGISIAITYIMSTFLAIVKKNNKIEWGYALQICFAVAIATLVRELTNQQSERYKSNARKKMAIVLRTLFYEKLMNSNYEFLSIVNSGFIGKMTLFDMDPIIDCFSTLPSIAAFPVITIFAFFLIWQQLAFSWYFSLVLAFYLLSVFITVYLLKFSVNTRKVYRSTTTAIHGYLAEYVTNIKFIKINRLESVLLKDIWRVRRKLMNILKKLYIFTTFVDMMFFTPTLATSLLAIAVQRWIEGSFNVVTMYVIINCLSQLRKPLLAVVEASEKYTDYQRSYASLTKFFDEVPEFPRLRVTRIPVVGQPANEVGRVVFQHPVHLDKSKFPKVLEDDFSVWYKNCTFLDQTKAMQIKVNEIYREIKSDPLTKIKLNEQLVLKRTNLRIKKNAKVCCVGSEQSGIEMFMLSLKKELELIEGELYTNGKVCIFDRKKMNLISDLSIRDNIILDNVFDPELFDNVCCTLGINFTKFSGREYSKVSEYAKSITREQETLILLARTLYQDFEIVCLFNFFNMLHYEEKLDYYERIIEEHLLYNTVFFYSTDVALAKKADLVLYFDNGHIVEKGTFKELSANPNSKYSQFMTRRGVLSKFKMMLEGLRPGVSERKRRRRKPIFGLDDEVKKELLLFKKQGFHTYLTVFFASVVFMKRRLRALHAANKTSKKKVVEGVPLSKGFIFSLRKILGTYSRVLFPILMVLILLSSLMLIFWDVWLGWWSQNFLKFKVRLDYFYVLIGLSGFVCVYILVRSYTVYWMLLKVGHNLFLATLDKVVRSEIGWFEYFTPRKIIYRMTTDVAGVDTEFPRYFLAIVFNFFTVCCALLVLNFVYPGLFLIVTIPLVWYLYFLISRYLRSARLFIAEMLHRQAKWYYAQTMTLRNLIGLRYLSKQRYFEKYYLFVLVEYMRIGGHAASAGKRWVGVRISLVIPILMFVVYLCPVIQGTYVVWNFKQNIWILGLGLTWSSKLIDYMWDWLNPMYSLLVNIEYYERLLELHLFDEEAQKQIDYLNNYEEKQNKDDASETNKAIKSNSEPTKDIDKQLPKIELSAVTYVEKGQVLLNNSSLSLMRGDSVALIQQNGSSIPIIFELLVRLRHLRKDIENKNSTQNISMIKIDGKRVEEYKSADLRDKFLLLKADPLLFTGTVRDNVDPYQYFTDDQIIRVLHFLGLYKAYSQHIKERKVSVIDRHIDAMDTKITIENSIFEQTNRVIRHDCYNMMKMLCRGIFCCGKQKKPAPMSRKGIYSRKKGANNHLMIKNHKLRLMIGVARISIILNRILKERRIRTNILKEEKQIRNELHRIEVINKNSKKLFSKKGYRLDAPIFSGFKKSRFDKSKDDMHFNQPQVTKELLKNFRFSKYIDTIGSRVDSATVNIIDNHVIKSSRERESIQKLLKAWISHETNSWSIPMKRVLCLARVILEKPEILLVEENAMIIDHSWNLEYLDAVFASLKESTILCEMSSYKILDKFKLAAIFDENSIVESGGTKEMLQDEGSLLVEKLRKIDSRKIRGRPLRSNSFNFRQRRNSNGSNYSD